MGENNNSCFNGKYKPKGKKKFNMLSNKISFAEIDEVNGLKYIHYCSFHVHPGTIGLKHLYKKDCLNGCSYYKRFILENQQDEAYTEYFDMMMKMRGAPKEEEIELTPREPRKEKKQKIPKNIFQEETKIKEKIGINPYVPKEEKIKEKYKHLINLELKQEEKRRERLEIIANNPDKIGLPSAKAIEVPFLTGSTNQYDILFEKEDELIIFSYKSPSSNSSKQATREILEQILTDTQKICFGEKINVMYGDETKVTQKRKNGVWFSNQIKSQ
ncbi:hypothetical protein GW932_03170 [archaeon]|nr:hypothetical protein [archaeon]